MQLYHSPNSPYSRKCRIIAHERGIPLELVAVDTANPAPDFLAVSPVGRVPALKTDAGMLLCESPVICEYLDTQGSGKSFYDDRICVLAMAAMAEGIIDSAVACVLENRRPEPFRYGAWIERKEKAITRTIAQFAKISLDDAPLSIGTITLGVALAYVSFRLPHIEWRGNYPQLAAWLDAMNARTSFMATMPVA